MPDQRSLTEMLADAVELAGRDEPKDAQAGCAKDQPQMTKAETMEIFKDWKAGMSYDELHRKYGPWNECGCDACAQRRREETNAD